MEIANHAAHRQEQLQRGAAAGEATMGETECARSCLEEALRHEEQGTLVKPLRLVPPPDRRDEL